MNILLIEDDSNVATIVKMCLEYKGQNQVHHLTNGPEALVHLQSSAFDLVLLDMNMPVMSGIEVAERIRAMGLEMPVIFLSAQQDLAQKTQIQELNCGIIAKPFEPLQIEALILDWIEKLAPSSKARAA